jgi:hypothetical protein
MAIIIYDFLNRISKEKITYRSNDQLRSYSSSYRNKFSKENNFDKFLISIFKTLSSFCNSLQDFINSYNNLSQTHLIMNICAKESEPKFKQLHALSVSQEVIDKNKIKKTAIHLISCVGFLASSYLMAHGIIRSYKKWINYGLAGAISSIALGVFNFYFHVNDETYYKRTLLNISRATRSLKTQFFSQRHWFF